MIPDFVQQVARYEEITSSAVDFSDVLNVVEIHRTFWRFNIVRHGSVHLDAR